MEIEYGTKERRRQMYRKEEKRGRDSRYKTNDSQYRRKVFLLIQNREENLLQL
jgi:hypothetical protein